MIYEKDWYSFVCPCLGRLGKRASAELERLVSCRCRSGGYSFAILFSYRDLNGTVQNTEEEEFTHVFRHFELPEKGCEVLAVSVERSRYIRHLLLVYKDGRLTDWMEAGISTNENLATKQWKIEADGTVEIYSLKVLGNRSVLFDEDFNTVRMQREDDVYQIDDKGKFKRVEKAKFPAREYSKAELQDKERNIWDD